MSIREKKEKNLNFKFTSFNRRKKNNKIYIFPL